jgi:hypothetical protein
LVNGRREISNLIRRLIIAAMAALLELKRLLMVTTTQMLATLMNRNVIHPFEL